MRPSFQFVCDAPVARLRIAGELDLSTAAQLLAVLERLSWCGCTAVELDVDAVTFVDAYTLALLWHEQRRLRAAGGDLRVVAASAWFQDVCRLADYDTLQPARDGRPHLTVLHTARHLHTLPVD